MNGVATSLNVILKESEILLLENWRKSAPILENLLRSECVGCTYTLKNFNPIYRVKKGNYIHFGLQSDRGVENLVFKKNGKFVTRFYMFQGESREHIREVLQDIQELDYVVEGIYPTEIEPKSIYLEHIEFENGMVEGNSWYPPMFPTEIRYRIDLADKIPVVRFKIDGGLYSYQKPDKNGAYQIINFVEPLMYANAVGIDEPMSYSSVTDAFYANATFLLLNLEEDAQVSIRIETDTSVNQFKFSVFENEGFYTMEEYLQEESPLFDRYQNTMAKGQYLVRILHENADYAEKPLYTVYIDKSNTD